MTVNRQLSATECSSAAAIQQAIDALGPVGGRLGLPALDLTLDRGIELRSNVELVGQGERTVLRKGPGRVYPLSGYHNYGMRDAPLLSAEGLQVGMTVSVMDEKRRGFYSTLARITWIDGNWVGLDDGIRGDYLAGETPRLTTAHPIVFGRYIHDAAIRDVAVVGNRADNPCPMDGCRGAGVYFIGSHRIEITGVREQDYHGEGIGFQMCSRVRIRNSSANGNTGNGLHPGAGSTDVLIENCAAHDNGNSGFFFCVRANHVTVRHGAFRNNATAGMSIGTRDCYNRIESCEFVGNRGPGILVRESPCPVEVHSCVIRSCRIEGNGGANDAQVEIQRDAHDLVLEDNTIGGAPGCASVGIRAGTGTDRICARRNRYANCTQETCGAVGEAEPAAFACGHDTVKPEDYRHLR